MKLTITAVSTKQMPSKWGGTWTIAKIKAQETGDKIWELNGYGQRTIESLKKGQTLVGYQDMRTWTDRSGTANTVSTFNKITAEYVYKLFLSKYPDSESAKPAIPKKEEKVNDMFEEANFEEANAPMPEDFLQ